MTINGVAYNWTMLQMVIPGLGINNPDDSILLGVSALKYEKSREIKKNYGSGGNLSSRGFGNKVCTASITMDLNTQLKLRNAVGSLLDLGQFDIHVSFANPIVDFAANAGSNPNVDGSDDWDTKTVVIKGCVFNKDAMESQNDDDNITTEFDLNPLDIEIR